MQWTSRPWSVLGACVLRLAFIFTACAHECHGYLTLDTKLHQRCGGDARQRSQLARCLSLMGRHGRCVLLIPSSREFVCAMCYSCLYRSCVLIPSSMEFACSIYSYSQAVTAHIVAFPASGKLSTLHSAYVAAGPCFHPSVFHHRSLNSVCTPQKQS